jgi:hypothetical protein
MLVFVAAGILAARDARAQEPERESAAMSANRGPRIGVGPTLILPQRSEGPWGVGVDVEARYGIKAGPLVFAPGVMLTGNVLSSRVASLATPTVRLTLPVGPLAPYVVGGFGVGWMTSPGDAGFAVLGGGGLVAHFGRAFALGGEFTYQRITGTEFGGFAFGPVVSFSSG